MASAASIDQQITHELNSCASWKTPPLLLSPTSLIFLSFTVLSSLLLFVQSLLPLLLLPRTSFKPSALIFPLLFSLPPHLVNFVASNVSVCLLRLSLELTITSLHPLPPFHYLLFYILLFVSPSLLIVWQNMLHHIQSPHLTIISARWETHTKWERKNSYHYISSTTLLLQSSCYCSITTNAAANTTTSSSRIHGSAEWAKIDTNEAEARAGRFRRIMFTRIAQADGQPEVLNSI